MLKLRMHHKATQATFNPSYTESEMKAIAAGFVEVRDERTYNGRYFMKNGKKWIHNLEALRKKLNAEYGRYIDDEELSAPAPEGFGYDTETYYLYDSTLSTHNEFSTRFRTMLEKVCINH